MVVTYGSFRNVSLGERGTLMGLPYANLLDVIYLQIGTAVLQGIPKMMVWNIEGAKMPEPIDETEPGEPGILRADDPRFERFRTAILLEERVRITYMMMVPSDPALPASINEQGIPSIVEGRAVEEEPGWLHVNLGGGGTAPDLKQAIPRGEVVDIVFLGPRPVKTEEMV